MDWQTIDTAPRDGTALLLICMTAQSPIAMIGHWAKHRAWAPEPAWLYAHSHDWPDADRMTVFQRQSAAESLGNIPAPTHWMPLPPPPTEKAPKQE